MPPVHVLEREGGREGGREEGGREEEIYMMFMPGYTLKLLNSPFFSRHVDLSLLELLYTMI